jgi:hypothetical protein
LNTHTDEAAAWDELDIELALIDAAVHAPRRRLTEVAAERTPAVYLTFLLTPAIGDMSCYRRVANGTYPVCVGSATDADERLRRHRRNTSVVPSLQCGEDVFVAVLPMQSYASAVYAEQLLITRLRPCWNERWMAGWGSRDQGRARRSVQSPPPWALLHPGRRVGERDAKVTTAFLQRKIASHLAATAVPLWEPLRSDP